MLSVLWCKEDYAREMMLKGGKIHANKEVGVDASVNDTDGFAFATAYKSSILVYR